MTDKKTEALKLALEALEDVDGIDTETECVTIDVGEAITAIREALAEQCVCGEPDTFGTHRTDGPCLAEQPAQEQEPYGWKVYGVNSLFMGEFAEADAKAESKRIGGTCIAFPLYTSPPASKPMTDEQKQAMRLYKAVERLSLQAGEETNESVDWLCGEHGGMFKLYEAYFSPKKPDGTCQTCESLSRAVMADHVFHDNLTKPLTDERLEEMWEADTTSSEDCKSLYFFKLVARAIEAAHGIKGDA